MRFQSVLVANRGEIACRIIRTCRDLGLETVAVYSDADVHAPHTSMADRAVRIGPPAPADSYLNMAAIVEAAQVTGAEAIHPGYGFLAENAEFAELVERSGLTFIGPSAESIRLMGDKAAARAFMESRGVPVAPGYAGDNQDDEHLESEASRIGFPVLVKAAAGGGGKGMSIVHEKAQLVDALSTARRIALNAFGDDNLLLEKYVDSPRHIEVQIVGDKSGRVIHLFERECSIQRRFQKVIEEAPSPGVDDALRARLCDAAVTAGESLGYVGAGTVEFILSEGGDFYFLEVNTRLQVEHPVTEMITGVDLVALQVAVAQGETLPDQSEIAMSGHSLECRLYAEDPANQFLPSIGQLIDWQEPSLQGVRVDSGVQTGSEVSIHYDPMLAKIISYGPHRAVAIDRMIRALDRLQVHGLKTNRDFLKDVLKHDAFRDGALSTHFLGDYFEDWSPEPPGRTLTEHVIAAAAWSAWHRAARRNHLPHVRPGWRNNPGDGVVDHWFVPDEEHRVRVQYRRLDSVRAIFSVDDEEVEVERFACGADFIDLAIVHGETGLPVRVRYTVVSGPDGSLFVESYSGRSHLKEEDRFPVSRSDDDAGGCVAPMPGRVVSVAVALGDMVEAGQTLIILEAMKMEQTLVSSQAGQVAQVLCEPHDVVNAGQVLIEVEPHHID